MKQNCASIRRWGNMRENWNTWLETHRGTKMATKPGSIEGRITLNTNITPAIQQKVREAALDYWQKQTIQLLFKN
ncbi:hypothetical protein FGO68_gene713 [Halteria grandinella]|uniref:Uncharacterized protein n=1 Tax=Halteria grandinella TaxID=5974 RepID=A0A8J8NJG9_HALGN|nr:hypothetical protein FGO68_gene713 [Halteria grandinella]